MKVARSIAAVAAGYAVIAVTLRVAEMGSFFRVLVATVLGALAAGFITAWIAGRREIPHASALGFILIAISFYSLRQQPAFRPGWYEIAIAGCGPIAAMVGAAIRLLTKRPANQT